MSPDFITFSFILSGIGSFESGENIWDVAGPCAFTPSAVTNCRYGPSDWWEEIYIGYPVERAPRLEALGYIRSGSPVWKIQSMAYVMPIVDELRALSHDIHLRGSVDRIDALCENLIRETIIAESEAPQGLGYERLIEVRSRLQHNYKDDPDIPELARHCGMSESTFRRAWARHFHHPPKQYVITLRIREACRLLVGTPTSIAAIAERVGFRDAFYFTRAFRKRIGMTPSEYRQQIGHHHDTKSE